MARRKVIGVAIDNFMFIIGAKARRQISTFASISWHSSKLSETVF